MATRYRHYSDFLANEAALVGLPADRVTTEIAASWNAFFNSAMGEMWRAGPWIQICPYGEARFVGNLLTYPNNLSKTANWDTNVALTITGNSLQNPADGRTTASKLLETAATSAHSISQTGLTSFYPSTNYTISAYFRQNGRTWAQITVNDGVGNFSAFFDLANVVTGTVSGTGATATIGQQANGF